MKKIISIISVIVIAVLLYLFQPWKLWTSITVDESLPTEVVKTESGSEKQVNTEPKLLKKGSFRSIAHETTGEASIYELADGKKVLRLENLVSSDGPDVKVVITTIKDATEGWEKSHYFKISDSKATHGNINYEIPDNINLEDMGSIVLWCERFNESFGAATLN